LRAQELAGQTVTGQIAQPKPEPAFISRSNKNTFFKHLQDFHKDKSQNEDEGTGSTFGRTDLSRRGGLNQNAVDKRILLPHAYRELLDDIVLETRRLGVSVESYF
jgi:hypothetical protein